MRCGPGSFGRFGSGGPRRFVIDDARREEDDPLVSLVHPAVMQAIAQAAESGALPDQIAEAGLKPWQVRKCTRRCRPACAARAI